MRSPPQEPVGVPWPRALLACALPLLAGCVGEPTPAGPPAVSRAVFEAEIYPLMLRDCGFPACHGAPDRFFRVHGPNRTRLGEETALDAPPTRAEVDLSYERARSMLASAPSPDESLLVRKPLEVDVGGAPHVGIDRLGRDVYDSRAHPSWRALLEWAGGEPAGPGEDEGAGAGAGVDGAEDGG